MHSHFTHSSKTRICGVWPCPANVAQLFASLLLLLLTPPPPSVAPSISPSQTLSCCFLSLDTPHPSAIVRTRTGRMDPFVGHQCWFVSACECGSKLRANICFSATRGADTSNGEFEWKISDTFNFNKKPQKRIFSTETQTQSGGTDYRETQLHLSVRNGNQCCTNRL